MNRAVINGSSVARVRSAGSADSAGRQQYGDQGDTQHAGDGVGICHCAEYTAVILSTGPGVDIAVPGGGLLLRRRYECDVCQKAFLGIPGLFRHVTLQQFLQFRPQRLRLAGRQLEAGPGVEQRQIRRQC